MMRQIKSPFLRYLKRGLDAWSVPHFLFGMVMALGGVYLELPLFPILFLMVILAVIWEYIERRLHIHEAPGNPLMDIFLPVLAFGMTLLLVDQAPLHQEEHLGLFVSVTALYGLVNLAAWRARFEKDRDFLK